MIKNSIKFSICNIVFEYIYDFVYEINSNIPINNFLVNKGNVDILNHIIYDASLLDPTFNNKEPSFITPAWSYYDDEKIFVMHPNNVFIGIVKLIDGFSRVETIVNTLAFLPQPAPICVLGLLLQNALLSSNNTGLLMHGATVRINGKNLLLMGNSGVGKTTLSRIIMNSIGQLQISDDRFVLAFHNNEFHSWGNPLDVKVERNHNIGCPIDAVLFLAHGPINRLSFLDSEIDVFSRIIKSSMLPYWNIDACERCVDLLKRWKSKGYFYCYEFLPNESAITYLLSELGW